jgi:hypothetical protein
VEPGALSEELTALLLADPTPAYPMPSDVDALLADNGVALPRGNPDRTALALATLRARVDAFRVVEARRSGDATETPERPERLAPPPPPPKPVKRVSEMRTRWIELFAPGQKQIDDNKL